MLGGDVLLDSCGCGRHESKRKKGSITTVLHIQMLTAEQLQKNKQLQNDSGYNN